MITTTMTGSSSTLEATDYLQLTYHSLFQRATFEEIGKTPIVLSYNYAGMIVGPCVGYAIQSVKMYRAKSVEGFSPLICFILLSANVLRVLWW